MSETPKCTSWRGHKFEARYSSEPREIQTTYGDIQGSAAIEAVVLMRTKRTYERDICVRCGATIEKPPAKT